MTNTFLISTINHYYVPKISVKLEKRSSNLQYILNQQYFHRSYTSA